MKIIKENKRKAMSVTQIISTLPWISANSFSNIWVDATSLDSSPPINHSLAYSTVNTDTLLSFEHYWGLCTGYHLCLEFSPPRYPCEWLSQFLQVSPQRSLISLLQHIIWNTSLLPLLPHLLYFVFLQSVHHYDTSFIYLQFIFSQ